MRNTNYKKRPAAQMGGRHGLLPDILAARDGHMLFFEEPSIPSRYTVAKGSIRSKGYRAQSSKGTYEGKAGVFVWLVDASTGIPLNPSN